MRLTNIIKLHSLTHKDCSQSFAILIQYLWSRNNSIISCVMCYSDIIFVTLSSILRINILLMQLSFSRKVIETITTLQECSPLNTFFLQFFLMLNTDLKKYIKWIYIIPIENYSNKYVKDIRSTRLTMDSSLTVYISQVLFRLLHCTIYWVSSKSSKMKQINTSLYKLIYIWIEYKNLFVTSMIFVWEIHRKTVEQHCFLILNCLTWFLSSCY